MTSDEQLLTPEFIRSLEQLDFISRKIFAGKLRGERRSKRRGQSVEFADYREYAVGDDLRFIDWNLYGRLDRLFLKLFLEEEDLSVHLLLDTSASMDFGDPSKLWYARRIVAALGYISLVHQDRLTVCAFGPELHELLPAARGRHNVWRLMQELSELKPEGASDFNDACRTFALKHRRKGIVIVLSDFFAKDGYDDGFRYLLGGRNEVCAIHTLCREEIRPQVGGDLRLIDSEDGEFAEVTISAPLLKKYDSNLRRFCSDLKNYCSRRGINYVFTDNQYPFEQLVLRYLRERGMLK